MNLLSSASVFSFFTIISRILGYLRDILIAIFLGASIFADAFFVAFRLPNTFRRSTDGLTAYFSITDEFSNEQLSVSYSGEIGEIFFNENAEIIIQGKMQQDGIFLTNTLSIKCPSKYVDSLEDGEDYS